MVDLRTILDGTSSTTEQVVLTETEVPAPMSYVEVFGSPDPDTVAAVLGPEAEGQQPSRTTDSEPS